MRQSGECNWVPGKGCKIVKIVLNNEIKDLRKK